MFVFPAKCHLWKWDNDIENEPYSYCCHLYLCIYNFLKGENDLKYQPYLVVLFLYQTVTQHFSIAIIAMRFIKSGFVFVFILSSHAKWESSSKTSFSAIERVDLFLLNFDGKKFWFSLSEFVVFWFFFKLPLSFLIISYCFSFSSTSFYFVKALFKNNFLFYMLQFHHPKSSLSSPSI